MLWRVNELETYKDIEIDKRWLYLSNFAHDIKELPGYNEWLTDRDYQLDKDIKISGSKIYSRDTCMFVTRKENMDEMLDRLEKGRPIVGTSKIDGSTIEFSSNEEARRYGFNNVYSCLKGKRKSCGGYTWTYK